MPRNCKVALSKRPKYIPLHHMTKAERLSVAKALRGKKCKTAAKRKNIYANRGRKGTKTAGQWTLYRPLKTGCARRCKSGKKAHSNIKSIVEKYF